MKNIAVGIALLAMWPQGASTTPPSAACKWELVHESKSAANQEKLQGDVTGYKRAPVIAFEVSENGRVQNARVKRSSGSAAADKFALNEVRNRKYKPAPGCGVLESEATVTVDFATQ